MTTTIWQIIKIKKNGSAKVLKGVKLLCKEFDFTAGILIK